MDKLEDSAVEKITQRLSGLPDLHLPFALSRQGESLSRTEKKAHLSDLLHRDPAVFLERHGPKLSIKELNEFDVLNGVYEVDWYLKKLRSSRFPASAKEQKAHASLVKNRRLAFMDRLIQDGEFFSEGAMKMRAPLLYYEYLGQFQDPSDIAFARPGERWSDMLIRQGEEAEYQARLRTEREKAGIPVEKEDHQHGIQKEEEEEEVEEEEEEEEDDDDDEEDGELKEKEKKEDSQTMHSSSRVESYESEGHRPVRTREAESRPISFEEQQQRRLENFSRFMQEKFLSEGGDSKPTISSEELQSKMDDFMRIMQEKFLSGEDSEHFDYVRIDHDAVLDDYWLEEMSQDAEDKYFEED